MRKRDYDGAVTRLIEQEADAARALDAGLTREIAAQLGSASTQPPARRGPVSTRSAVAIPLLIVLAGLLVLIGLERRIGEYQ